MYENQMRGTQETPQDHLDPQTFVPGKRIPVGEFTPELNLRMARNRLRIPDPNESERMAQPQVPEGKVLVDEKEYGTMKEIYDKPEVIDAVVKALFPTSKQEASGNYNPPVVNNQPNNVQQQNLQNNQGMNINQPANNQDANPNVATNDNGSDQSNDTDDVLAKLLGTNRNDQNKANDVNVMPEQSNPNNQNINPDNQQDLPRDNNQNNNQINNQGVDPAQFISDTRNQFIDNVMKEVQRENLSLPPGQQLTKEQVVNFMQQLNGRDIAILAKDYYNAGATPVPKNISDAGSTPRQVPVNRSAIRNTGGVDPNKFFQPR